MSDTLSCGHPMGALVSTEEGTNYCGWCEEEARSSPEGQLQQRVKYLENQLAFYTEKVRQLSTQVRVERERHKGEIQLTNHYIYSLHVAEARLNRIEGMECTCDGREECPVCVARQYKTLGYGVPDKLVCIVNCPCCDAALIIRHAEEPGEFIIDAEERPCPTTES